jgi:serine/threonine-protein kinase
MKLELVHRDISPHNILVGIDGVSKLTDFGVAKVLGGLPDDLLFGDVRGKPGYLAPEQSKKLPLDRRADLFSAGVVLWELLAGRKLYSGEVGVAPDVREFAPKVSKPLAEMVKRALNLEPSQRFATALEMSDALEEAVRPASARDVAKLALQLCGKHVTEMREAVRRAAVGESKPPAAIAAALAQPASAPLEDHTSRAETVLDAPAPERPLLALREPKRPAISRPMATFVVGLGITIGVGIGVWRFGATAEAPVQEISDPVQTAEPPPEPDRPLRTATITLDIDDIYDEDAPRETQRRHKRDKRPKPKPPHKNPYQ